VQGALNVSGSIATKLGDLFNKTNGVLVAAVMSTIGRWLGLYAKRDLD
jgi:chitin synthase